MLIMFLKCFITLTKMSANTALWLWTNMVRRKQMLKKVLNDEFFTPVVVLFSTPLLHHACLLLASDPWRSVLVSLISVFLMQSCMKGLAYQNTISKEGLSFPGRWSQRGLRGRQIQDDMGEIVMMYNIKVDPDNVNEATL